MKLILGTVLLFISSASAYAAPAPEVGTDGSIAALVVSAGVAAWFVERRRRRP